MASAIARSMERRVAAGNVGTESDVKSLFKITPDRSDTRREIGIGLWAVGDEYTPVLHQGELCIRTVYAVRHDRRQVLPPKRPN